MKRVFWSTVLVLAFVIFAAMLFWGVVTADLFLIVGGGFGALVIAIVSNVMAMAKILKL